METNSGFDKKVLLGADLSGNNKNSLIPQGLPFYFIKATEGKTFVNESFDHSMLSVWNPNDMPIYGFYHFARPENNSAQDEAEAFLKRVNPHIGSCLFALDWESEALNASPKWAKEWLENVYNKTGVRPFFYSSASFLDKCKKSADWYFLSKYPLWVAQYGNQLSYSELKTSGNMWQFTSNPIDLDIFYGTYEDLQLKAIPYASS